MINAVNVDKAEGAREIIRVFALISQVSAAIDEAERSSSRNLDVYRRDIIKWVGIATAAEAGDWRNAKNPESGVPARSLDDLLRLGHFLEGRIFEVNEAREPELRDLLREVSELLESSGLSPELTRYIANLIREIQAALDGESLGFGFDIAEAIRRLWVCLGAAENEANENDGKRFATLRSKILPGVATSVASGAILSGGTAVFNALGM